MEQLNLMEFYGIKGQPKGRSLAVEPVSQGFQLHYEHPNGRLLQGNSLDWLASLAGSSVDRKTAERRVSIR
jgi:site-specific DNA-methyltransferase (adenine-specific)